MSIVSAVRLRSNPGLGWRASTDSNHQPAVPQTPATLGVPAKLSNEAVKCRKCDALRQADHNI